MTVIAVAGRRIDAENAKTARFPLANVPLVRRRLDAYLAAHGAMRLVASAACGADLLALDAARAAGIPRRIVLPFDRATFRTTSVIDRPGDWGSLYSVIIAEAAAAGDLIELDLTERDEAAYQAANERILSEAAELAAGEAGPPRVCIVWEGGSRGAGDHSMALADGGDARGWPVDDKSVLTVERMVSSN